MMMVSAGNVAGKRVVKTLGIFRGNTVRVRHIGPFRIESVPLTGCVGKGQGRDGHRLEHALGGRVVAVACGLFVLAGEIVLVR